MWSTDAIHIWGAKMQGRLFLSSVLGVSITELCSTNSFMLSGSTMNRTAVTVTNTSESFIRTSFLVIFFFKYYLEKCLKLQSIPYT